LKGPERSGPFFFVGIHPLIAALDAFLVVLLARSRATCARIELSAAVGRALRHVVIRDKRDVSALTRRDGRIRGDGYVGTIIIVSSDRARQKHERRDHRENFHA
jgi:hypothetical protein